MRAADVAATYESYTGHTPRDLEFYLVYASIRHAVVMTRVARRSILFGEMEAPADPDDLIMHRATLEQMLGGTDEGGR
jgi:aminoglycoside phosphotransferase (APT) family kinase protein